MRIGIIGLGKMGGNMAQRMLRGGHELVALAAHRETVEKFLKENPNGAEGAEDLRDLVGKLDAPRLIWLMLPAGDVTENAVKELAEIMEADDTLIDGGNSHFTDDCRRAALLRKRGIHYLDVGTSGGVWGAERGYCLMIGGCRTGFKAAEEIFKTLAPGAGEIPESKGRENSNSTAAEGYLYCGKAGAGHFVKMVHNGIEYGLMQAYAEGFDILKNAAFDKLPEARQYDLNLPDIAELWRRGSVISSWLLDLTAASLAENADLKDFSGFNEDSGEGRWTVEAAIEEEVSANVLAAALFARFRSRQQHTFAEKIISAMRNQFGGHVEPKDAPQPEKVGEEKMLGGKDADKD